MSDEIDIEQGAPKKSGKSLLIGLLGAVLLGTGGFLAIYFDLIPFGGSESHAESVAEPLAPVSYVPIEPILVSLASRENARHLRFRAHLEIEPAEQQNIELVMPRILDVLNVYLRAVDVADLERSTFLIRMRAQMLRRIQTVVGEGRVRDLLITEFVLN